MRTQAYKYGVLCEKTSQQEYSDTTAERARIIDDFFLTLLIKFSI
jgi:hypothetical protein